MVSVMSVSSEALLSDLPLTKFPRELSTGSSFKSVLQHLALKTCSILFVLPFYSAHLVESVQVTLQVFCATYFLAFVNLRFKAFLFAKVIR